MELALDAKHLQRLRGWGQRHARKLPWREAGVYEVAVAEVLLQKTRGDAIEAYWLAVIAHYPDFEHLARARRATLSRIVAPLGLADQRAGRLIKMAETFVAGEGTGGVGPYGRAVVALTAGQRVTHGPIDGNVARVLTRITGWAWPRGEPRKKPELKTLAAELVSGPPKQALATLYALVDLGALVCTPRNPHCTECPLAKVCMSARV
jgi:A/G-specific adenine glycosylase